MGYSVIKGAREMHGVRLPEQYRTLHEGWIASRRRRGERVEIHEVETPSVASVDRLSGWIILCECGAGNSTDPEWGFACCFGCGAVHTNIVLPEAWREIEQLLLQRPLQRNRSWEPNETLDDLRADNARNGVVG